MQDSVATEKVWEESSEHTVERVLRDISHMDPTQFARDENESHFFQIRAAWQQGFSEPFTPEQAALNTILSKLKAGRDMTDKAWDLYAQYKGHTSR